MLHDTGNRKPTLLRIVSEIKSIMLQLKWIKMEGGNMEKKQKITRALHKCRNSMAHFSMALGQWLLKYCPHTSSE